MTTSRECIEVIPAINQVDARDAPVWRWGSRENGWDADRQVPTNDRRTSPEI
jgi:hypothetical protein